MSERSATVLLVDDDPVTRELFTILLEPNGINLVTAATSAEAHDLALSSRPELILLDLSLGGADGLALTNELRHRLGKEMPLLVVSASSDSETRQRAFAAGATGFIAKPVNSRTFSSEVKRYLPQKKERLTVELDWRERRVRELRAQFLETALSSIERLAKRNDDELLSDTLLADAAHKWVGASSIEGVPDVEEIARELEILARGRRADQVSYIRDRLGWLEEQFRASLEPVSSV